MNQFINNNIIKNTSPFLGNNDTIVDVKLLPMEGGFALKVTKKSCGSGFVTDSGISSKESEAVIIGSGNLPTFSNEEFTI